MIIGEGAPAIMRSFYESINKLSSPSDCLPVNYWEHIYSNVLCRVYAEQELRLVENIAINDSAPTVFISKKLY